MLVVKNDLCQRADCIWCKKDPRNDLGLPRPVERAGRTILRVFHISLSPNKEIVTWIRVLLETFSHPFLIFIFIFICASSNTFFYHKYGIQERYPHTLNKKHRYHWNDGHWRLSICSQVRALWSRTCGKHQIKDSLSGLIFVLTLVSGHI